MIVYTEKTLDSRPVIEEVITWKESHGYTWEEVANLTGITRNTFYLWRKGKKNASIDSILEISRVTGIPLKRLIGDRGRANIAVMDCPVDLWGLFTSERGRDLLLKAIKKTSEADVDEDNLKEQLKWIGVKADYLV